MSVRKGVDCNSDNIFSSRNKILSNIYSSLSTGTSAIVATSTLFVTKKPTIPNNTYAAKTTFTLGQDDYTLGAVPLKLTTLPEASVIRVSLSPNATNMFTIPITSYVAVEWCVLNTEQSRASAVELRATIHAPTSATEIKSTKSAEETLTTSRNPSVVTMRLFLAVATVTMQAVAIAVCMIHAPSFVSTVRCTKSAVSPLMTLQSTFAAQTTLLQKSAEVTPHAVWAGAMTQSDTSVMAVKSFLYVGRRVIAPSATSVVMASLLNESEANTQVVVLPSAIVDCRRFAMVKKFTGKPLISLFSPDSFENIISAFFNFKIARTSRN